MTRRAAVLGGGVAAMPPKSIRQLLWFAWKVVIVMSVTLCALAFLRLQHYSVVYPDSSSASFSFSSSSPPVRHRSRLMSSYNGNPKVAFLFLVRKNLPLDFLWDSFFEHADIANFSIFVHSEPGFIFDESTTKSAFFYNRQLDNSIKVEWGGPSMIEAERLLLRAAIENPANQRFVLLSDSCVPLYNFSYIYDYLIDSPRSFVDSFQNVEERRYHPKMSPVIPKKKWRKGSQWIALVRKHAKLVVDDGIILPVLKAFCKRYPPLDPRKGKQIPKLLKQHDCIPDEHYVQTLLAVKDLEDEIERRTLTYTSWNQTKSKNKLDTTGWHPMTFNFANANLQHIQKIKDIKHIEYQTEFRIEWCRNNSTFVPCFLFARKFSQPAAMRLLSEGVLGKYDAPTIQGSM